MRFPEARLPGIKQSCNKQPGSNVRATWKESVTQEIGNRSCWRKAPNSCAIGRAMGRTLSGASLELLERDTTPKSYPVPNKTATVLVLKDVEKYSNWST